MAAVRRAKLAGTVSWSDGSPFNGFAVFTVSPPTDATGAAWPTIALGASTYPRQRIALRFTVPIVNGQFNQTASLPYTADLNPPNTRYAANYYDIGWTLVGGPTAVFTIAADTITPTVPTLTVPTAPVTQTTPLET